MREMQQKAGLSLRPGDVDFVAGQVAALTGGLVRSGKGAPLDMPSVPSDLLGVQARADAWIDGFLVGLVTAQLERSTFATFRWQTWTGQVGASIEEVATRCILDNDHDRIIRQLKLRGVRGGVSLQTGNGPVVNYDL